MAENGSAHIGERIAKYRKLAGFKTAKALSDALGDGVTVAVIQNIESGRRRDLSISQLIRIADAVEISPVFLMYDIELPGKTVAIEGAPDRVGSMRGVEFDMWFTGEGRPRGENTTNKFLALLRARTRNYVKLTFQLSSYLHKRASIDELGEGSMYWEEREFVGDRPLEYARWELREMEKDLHENGVDLTDVLSPPFPNPLLAGKLASESNQDSRDG
ncbi:MAG: helix-turn-helix domain-containing protein [Rhodoglobus sp.]